MKNATTIKKFQFFDIESDNKLGETEVNNLSNVSPYSMFAVNQVVFLNAKLKKKVDHSYLNQSLILKVIKNKIVDEYSIFNKMIYFFQLKYFGSKYYFITCGGDFKEHVAGNEKIFIFLTSIKIYDATELIEKNHVTKDKNIDQYLIKQINLLKNIETGEIYSGKDYAKNLDSFNNIISFAVSNDMRYCTLGLDRGQIIMIQVFIFQFYLFFCLFVYLFIYF